MEQIPIRTPGKIISRTSRLTLLTGILLLFSLIYAAFVNLQQNELKTELAAVKTELNLSQTKLFSTETMLISLQSELGSTKQTLASTQTVLLSTRQAISGVESDRDSIIQELASTQEGLISTQRELASAQASLADSNRRLAEADRALVSIQDVLSSTQAALAAANQSVNTYRAAWETSQQQLQLRQKTLSGLGISVDTIPSYSGKNPDNVILNENAAAAEPTYLQLMNFLARDDTEFHEYVLNEYDCSQYSEDLFNRAEAAGIKSGYVILRFSNGTYGHALNVFRTSDSGLVYVDSTKAPDKIARVELDKAYKSVEAQNFAPGNLRNDDWWDSLTKYYFIESPDGGPTVTSSIQIYY